MDDLESISDWHLQWMANFIEGDLRCQERASNAFFNRQPRVVQGRPAASQELADHLATLDPYEDA